MLSTSPPLSLSYPNMRFTLLLSVIFIYSLHHPCTAATLSYNVMDFGAQPDGSSDSTDSFLAAWTSACQSLVPSTFYVPNGTFLLGDVSFQGPCKSNQTVFHNDGTLVAHPTFNITSPKDWIVFKQLEGVLVHGGMIDGQGEHFWKYKLKFGKETLKGGKVSFFFSSNMNSKLKFFLILTPSICYF